MQPKQLILDQTRQNGCQTVPFGVYIHNLMFVFILKCVEKGLSTVLILPLACIDYLELTISSLKQLILDQTRQNGCQTVPFGVYIHNLMFVFILE